MCIYNVVIVVFVYIINYGAGCWNTVLALIGWGIYKYTNYKTTQDVYLQAVKYSHEIGYVLLGLAAIVIAFLVYKGMKRK